MNNHPTEPAVSSTHHRVGHVVVIGAGLTGVVCAHLLATRGVRVTVLEASDRAGGQICSTPVPAIHGSLLVDVGAESMHLGAPQVSALITELSLVDQVVAARAGTSALLRHRDHRLVPLPAGVGPTGPTQIGPVVRSGLLSVRGLARASLEPLLARRRFTDPVSVGALISRRFGAEVATTFVEPLLGNLHASDIHQLGVAETAPQLLPVALHGRSLLWQALKPRPPAPSGSSSLPAFATLSGGLTSLVDRLLAHPQISLLTATAADSVRRAGAGWLVTAGDQSFDADQVVIAVPGEPGARLIDALCQQAATALRAVTQVPVATVLLGYDREAAAANPVLARYNGFMLTSQRAGTFKAMTNLSRKWPTLDEARHHLVRLSVGHSSHQLATTLSDEELIDRSAKELSALIGLADRHQFSTVVRFTPGMPQLGPGHLDRITSAKASLVRLAPGLHLTGGSVDGLGIGACVKAARRIADQIAAQPNATA